jgi:hypothetical protein
MSHTECTFSCRKNQENNKNEKHEIFEKCGMEGILMHGDWSLKN